MNHETTTPPQERLRLTTGMLMAWVAVVAVGLALVKGDVADWLPSEAIGWLSGVACVGTVVVIPWLDYRLNRSPESLRPPSPAGRRPVNLLVVGLLFCMASAIVLLGVLVYLIWAA